MKKKVREKVVVVNSLVMFGIVVVLLFGGIIRLAYITLSEVVDGTNLTAFANSRNSVTEVLYASRGNILDVGGEKLAQTVNSYTLIAFLDETRSTEDNIRHIENPESTAKILAPILEMNEEVLYEYLTRDKYQVEIKRNLTELDKSKIDALGIDGFGYTVSVARYYPSGTFASYLVGYAKINEDGEIAGELGVEGYYDDLLKGVDGSTTYQKDGYGYKLPNVPEYTIEAESGADIYLTIDSNIQFILENAIKKVAEDETAVWSIFAVMDAKTGAIVGSATDPSYNPNDLNTIESYLNPLVSYQFEPGSTMKTFSFAAAIEEGIYNGEDEFLSGSIDVAGSLISDYNNVGWGYIPYDTGFAYSSNVATSMIALELGTSTLMDYYDNLGFGQKTNIELFGEVKGDSNFYYPVELATASFGHGITVTPIQLLQAYTTITNNGTLLRPYVIDKIIDSSGKVTYSGKRTEIRNVYSSETVEYMKTLLSKAVNEGTSNVWITENVNNIGKSGTAQIASLGGYSEDEDDVIRSFMSIFPEEDPKYVLYMAVESYSSGLKGISEITTTAIEEIASYAKVNNDSDVDKVNPKIVIDNYISKKTDEVTLSLAKNKLNSVILGDGDYVIDQYPYKDNFLHEGDNIFIKTNGKEFIMPDLTSFSLNEVKTFSNLLGINLKVEGSGYVNSQGIKAGTVIDLEETLTVTLK